MTRLSVLFSAIALIPAMTGPLPELVRDGKLIVALCNGGTIALPLEGRDAPRGTVPCCAKGCRAGEKRKRFDPEQ